MLMKMELTLDLLPELEKRVKSLGGNEVKVGMFKEQGVHSSSKFRYVDLFRYLSKGNPSKNLPPRAPLETVAALVPLRTSPLRKDISLYLTNLQGTPNIPAHEVMGALGAYYRDKVSGVFGQSPPLAPNAPVTVRLKGKDSPLIDTGELKSKVAYKINNEAPKTK